MNDIRQYILSVITSALICSIVNEILTTKGTFSSVIRVISGLFLTITVIAPLINIEIANPERFFGKLTLEAESAAASGLETANIARAAIIKENTEALITEKAESMDLTIQANITLDEVQSVPKSVTIYGSVSPYSKRILSQFMQQALGIAEEDQQWM